MLRRPAWSREGVNHTVRSRLSRRSSRVPPAKAAKRLGQSVETSRCTQRAVDREVLVEAADVEVHSGVRPGARGRASC